MPGYLENIQVYLENIHECFLSIVPQAAVANKQLYLYASVSDVVFLSPTDCKPEGTDLLALALFASISVSIVLLSRACRVHSSRV